MNKHVIILLPTLLLLLISCGESAGLRNYSVNNPPKSPHCETSMTALTIELSGNWTPWMTNLEIYIDNSQFHQEKIYDGCEILNLPFAAGIFQGSESPSTIFGLHYPVTIDSPINLSIRMCDGFELLGFSDATLTLYYQNHEVCHGMIPAHTSLEEHGIGF